MKQASKTFLFLILLVLSKSNFALSKEEKACITKTIYIECRDKHYCTTKSWESILSVILNRQEAFSVWKFGAKSKDACSIVSSKEFSGSALLKSKVKEPEVYQEIQEFLEGQGYVSTSDYLFFNPRKNKMNLKGSLMKLIGGKK